eukprot:Lithocolla_globosa_v1_NODE_780_length_3288_cov_72.302815.p3 type:complete len:120 gc:universal NODE_780_length_3288_cov_72.302815:2708-2349(-)
MNKLLFVSILQRSSALVNQLIRSYRHCVFRMNTSMTFMEFHSRIGDLTRGSPIGRTRCSRSRCRSRSSSCPDGGRGACGFGGRGTGGRDRHGVFFWRSRLGLRTSEGHIKALCIVTSRF